MPLSRWRKLSQSTAQENPWWSYRLDRFLLPSGKEGAYHYVHTRGSVMVVPVLADRRLLLVNQYRYLMDRESLEFPGGGIQEGTSAEQSARTELAEETGRGASRLELVGEFNPFNGVTDEVCHVFLAQELEPVRGAARDETEEFELLCLAANDIDARIQNGGIWDGMTMATWQLVRPRLGPRL